MPPYLPYLAAILLGSLALVIYWSLSLSRYRAGSSGPCRVWAIGTVSLVATGVAVLLGLVFLFGMRVGGALYRVAVQVMGDGVTSAAGSRTAGIICGGSFVLLVVGGVIRIARRQARRSGPGSPPDG